MAKIPRKNPDESFGEFSSEPETSRDQGNNLEDFFRTSAPGAKESSPADDGFVASVSAAARKFMEMARLKKAPPAPAADVTHASSSMAGNDVTGNETSPADTSAPAAELGTTEFDEPATSRHETRTAGSTSSASSSERREPRSDRHRGGKRSEQAGSAATRNQNKEQAAAAAKPKVDLSAWDSLASELGIAPPTKSAAGSAESESVADTESLRSAESAAKPPGRVEREKKTDKGASAPAGRREPQKDRGQQTGRPEKRGVPEPKSPVASFDSFGAGLLGDVPPAPVPMERDEPVASDVDEIEVDYEVDDAVAEPFEEEAPLAELDLAGDEYVEFEVEELDPSSRRQPSKPREDVKSGHSPRRGHRDRRERKPVEADIDVNADLAGEISDEGVPGEEHVADPVNSEEEPRTGRSRRRRTRGRGRKRREGKELERVAGAAGDAEGPGENEPDEREAAKPAGDRGGRQRRPDRQVRDRNRPADNAKRARPADDEDDFLVESDDDQTASKPKNLPTWSETVDVIVQANMSSRKHSPQRRRGGGRPGNPSGGR